ncbi:ankyrin repeat and SOCS box protein 15-like [Anguilla anguilla]|uniref:ankyrin repeat and SOCS box protein 15-like n=1 Tax=Anguilla anguilla TaxID=7936 RepID=UPI0015AA6B42|nr:ankyrin repeat and SOCS box protein 15-like [Anguilla anguilla]XP_035283155.1 ankyrin repeat and SOCS box protein 15-like [Anguilla anguilla]
MDAIDEMDEDQVIDYAIQNSLLDSYKQFQFPSIESLEITSGENRRIVTAIEQGDIFTLLELSESTSAFSEVDNRGWLPLHMAAAQPMAQVLRIVLDASYELTLEEKTIEGDTAMTLAAQAGLVENVSLLLEKGASPNNTNDKNESPLLLAVTLGSYDMVVMLIMNGALVEQICLKKWTAMHEAAKVGCSDILMLLLRNGGQITQTTGHGVTPLGIAAENGHADVMEIIIKEGGDVNAQAYNGESVLYDAAGSGNPDCIDLLLQYGASPNVPSQCGNLPIHRAAYLGHYLVLEQLIQVTSKLAITDSGQSPIHSAAEGGHEQCLRLLIEHGFSVNVILSNYISEDYGDMRKSPLFFSVSNGDVTCTEILLNAGAKPDLDPLRCLLVAVRAGRYEIVKLLLARQADVNCYFTVVSDTVFPTALQYCLRDEMMMRLLLNNGYHAERCFCCHHDNFFSEYCPGHNIQLYQTSEQKEKIPFCDFISLSYMKHLSGSVVRILLDYVSHVPICSKLKLILEKQREWPEICEILGNPRPLKHLCRLVIRKQMTSKRLCDPVVMESAPFAPGVKRYLLYNEYDLYGRGMEQNK